ncbi:MAG: hypothetical protein JO264_10305 [Acidisphaera sp.]|nr:hypothetical protein [Acidisphaera sp.]
MDDELQRAIRAWCVAQTHAWKDRGIDRPAAAQEFADLKAQHESVYLFHFSDGDVSAEEKPGVDGGSEGTYRVGLYLGWFKEVVSRTGSDLRGTLAMDMHDGPHENPRVPVFGFQNTRGSSSILLPDMDLLAGNFFENHRDDLAYEDKAAQAVFVGSTTGSMHTVESLRRLENQRIRSALFFRDSPLVEFRLPNIVQCVTPEAADELREMGFGVGPMSWTDQEGSRLLLSMDGNGATCSRVALSLKSNSALVKYDSPHRLFYFSEMVPWRHFIPVGTDEEVLALVRLELAHPGYFRHVADEGRQFHERFLTREAALDYTAAVLREYFSCFVA